MQGRQGFRLKNMLEILYVQNFQSHSKLKIEFDKSITTIVGSSDIGKSAVVRALRWVCRNHPQGEVFIKDGTKGTTVKLLVDDKEVSRKRGKNENTYLLDGKEFKAFGQDVPDTISKVLNLNEINFQNQHDPPFWFSLSAGEVSRQLNAIVDLGIIDSSLSAISKRVRYFQQSAQISKERLKKVREQKEDINWVIEANNDYSIIEKHNEKRTELHHKATEIRNSIESSNAFIKTRNRASSQQRHVHSVGKLGQKCLKLSENKLSISGTIKLAKEQKKILDIGVPDIEKLEDVYLKVASSKIKREELRECIQDSDDLEVEVEIHLSYSKKVEQELHDATEGKCPVCGKEM